MKTARITLKKKLDEVYSIEPNNLGLGFLTSFYKSLTSRFKTSPYAIIIPLSFLVSLIGYLFLGYLLIKLVSLLQYGF